MTPRLTLSLCVGLGLLISACGGDEEKTNPEVTEPMLYTHTFDAIDIASGEEISGVCQQVTLGNEEPLYVTRIKAENEGAWHHSNWFFVPENVFAGDDGTWPCRDRNFDEVSAAVLGGVLFAQSTQSPNDLQQFPEGVGYVIPPGSKLVGSVHLLNVTAEEMDTAMTLEIASLPEGEITTLLNPFSFTILDLDIQPRAKSRFTMDCDFGGNTSEFDVHYVLPHYHELGTGLSLTRVGGSQDGEDFFTTDLRVGEPWGQAMDPPEPMAGPNSLRLSCTYDNPRDTPARYGIGEHEMCQFLGYSTSPDRFAGDSDGNLEFLGVDADGVREYRVGCDTLFVPVAADANL